MESRVHNKIMKTELDTMVTRVAQRRLQKDEGSLQIQW